MLPRRKYERCQCLGDGRVRRQFGVLLAPGGLNQRSFVRPGSLLVFGWFGWWLGSDIACCP